MRRCREAGYELGNIDATLIAQKPKLSPHKAAIKASLVRIMGVHESCINIKPSPPTRRHAGTVHPSRCRRPCPPSRCAPSAAWTWRRRFRAAATALRGAATSAPPPEPPATRQPPQLIVDAQRRAEAELAKLSKVAEEEKELPPAAAGEHGGPKGKEPTRCVCVRRLRTPARERGVRRARRGRVSPPELTPLALSFGDWERNGRCSDF